MALSWVGGTNFSQTTGTSLAASAPAGLSNGDLLLAAVVARSTITPPSGWTQVALTSNFTDGTSTQRLAVYQKNSTTSGDSSASFTWSQASSAVLAVCYAAMSGANMSPTAVTTTADNQTLGYLAVTLGSVTSTASGQIFLAFGSTTEGDPGGGNVSSDATFTRFTQATASNYRLAGFYHVTAGAGETTSGGYDLFLDDDYAGAGTFGLGSVLLLVTAGSGGGGGGSVDAIISADGPLGAPALVAEASTVGVISADGPLGSPSVFGYHDISGAINSGGVARYFVDLITPGGNVRVPISSWQATLQTDSAQYVQCVVPACAQWVDEITTATEFRITRLLYLNTGGTLEYQITQAPLQTAQYAQGSTNHSATLSGYIAAAPVVAWPSGLERTLTGVQTIFTYSSGLRVRCAIDWLLQPGQTAVVNSTPFTVSYINYIVSDSTEYMDVGQRLT